MSDAISGSDSQAAAIDWPAIHRRLQEVGESIQRENLPAAETAREILRARAAALAAKEPGADPDGERTEVLEFLLAGENYAIEASFVRETLALAEFTPLFCAPPFVLGITNVRGRIISIVDLRLFFDLPAVGLSDLNRLIIVTDGRMEFGVLADSIVGMRSLLLRDLQPALPTMTGVRDEFLRGMTGDRLALLDMGRILADKRLIVHEEVD